MPSRFRGKHVAAVLFALLVLVPASVSYAQNLENGISSEKAEKFVEMADRAGDKVGSLIEMIFANDSALQTIEAVSPELLKQLEDNRSLFETWGLGNLSDAYTSLDEGEYSYAIENATAAMSIFREVFKDVKSILAESGVEKGQLVDAQGLIQAMKRALDRIERLEEIGVLSEEALPLLAEATVYLDIPQALELLELGKVNQTAHNLAQANKLIAQAHKTLKKTAGEMNTHRIRNYFKVMSNFRERLGRQIEKLKDPGKKAELQAMLDAVSDLFTEAESLSQSEALSNLEQARILLEDAEQGLKEQRRAEKGNGNGNGKGNGNGNGNGSG